MLNSRDRIQEILETKEIDVMGMTINDFAEYINYSPSSIIKGLNQLGYSGWKDLKNKIYIRESLKDANEDLIIESIMSTNYLLKSNNSFDAFIEKIRNSKNISIQGLGKNRIITNYFSQNLNKIGHYSKTIEYKEEISGEEDLIIVLSESLNSQITKEILQKSSNKKINIAVLTFSKQNITYKINYLIRMSIFYKKNSNTSGSTTIKLYLVDKILDLI